MESTQNSQAQSKVIIISTFEFESKVLNIFK